MGNWIEPSITDIRTDAATKRSPPGSIAMKGLASGAGGNSTPGLMVCSAAMNIR